MNEGLETGNVHDVKKFEESLSAQRKGVELAVHDISVSFGGVVALKNISFSLEPGERLGVMGNSGAGKSTLCNVIAGTQKCSGKVTIHSKKAKSAVSRARKGMRRTNAHPAIFSELTLIENVLIGSPATRGDGVFPAVFFPKLFYKEKVEIALRVLKYCHVELDENSLLKKISLATKKRIELARALMGSPRVLIIDDISSGLSKDEQAQFCQVVLDFVDTFSTTLIVVDSELDVIRNLCQRAIVLDAGQLIADGEVDAVIRNEEVVKLYVGAVTR